MYIFPLTMYMIMMCIHESVTIKFLLNYDINIDPKFFGSSMTNSTQLVFELMPSGS